MNFFVSLSILIFIFSFWDSFDFAPMYCHTVVLLLSESLRNRETRQYESNAILDFLACKTFFEWETIFDFVFGMYLFFRLPCLRVLLLPSESLRNQFTRQFSQKVHLELVFCRYSFLLKCILLV